MRFEVTDTSGSDLTEFQIPINLDPKTFDYSKTSANGSDLRFTEDDEVTTLSYWVDTWNTSGVSTIWVKVNVSASSTDTFFMYYGNGSASSESNKSSTWLWYDDFSTNTSSLYNALGIDEGPWFNTTEGYVEFREYGGAVGLNHSLLYPDVLASMTNAVIEARVMISVQWEFQGGWWGIYARHNGNYTYPTTYGFDAKPNTTSVERPVLERFNAAARTQLVGASNAMANLNWYDVYATIGNSCDNASCNMTYTLTNVSTNTTLAAFTYNDTSASRILGPGIVAMGCYENTSVRYDYFGVRKIACSEPIVNLGEEEEIASYASRTDYFGGTAGISNLSNTTVQDGDVILMMSGSQQTAFWDDFENTPFIKWDDNYATSWYRDGAQQQNGSYSARASNGNEGYFISDDIDLSDATSADLRFWFRKDDTEGTDFTLYFYNGASWDLIDELDDNGADDIWIEWSNPINISTYGISNFTIGYDATLGTGENVWVDNLSVTKTLYNSLGNVTSINVSLEGKSGWDIFYANHSLPANTDISYQILRASDNTSLCTINATQAAAGYNISSCAGNTSPIKLYADLSTTDASVTPYLQTWNVTRAKVACSQTYDYIGVNQSTDDHFAYWCDIDAMPPTGPNLNSKTEANDAQYNQINSSDNVRWQTLNPGRDDYVFMWYDVTIVENPTDITNIDLFFEGYGETTGTFAIWVYDDTAGTWGQLGTTQEITTGSDSTMTRSITSNFDNYINASGVFAWGVYFDEAQSGVFEDGYWIATDYVKANVSYKSATCQ